MPFLFSDSSRGKINLGVWKIEEDEDFFASELSESVKTELAAMKGRRRVEYLASRHLLQKLLGDDVELQLAKDDFGKPYLKNLPGLFISLSHTRGYAAAIVGPDPVGIDIQIRVEKITRIAHKFISSQEYGESLDELSVEKMHLYWGAKESMFKIYGRKQMDFCRDLYVSHLDLAKGTGVGEISKPDFERKVDLSFRISEEFILVTGLLIPPTI